jgi:hypothetical protein
MFLVASSATPSLKPKNAAAGVPRLVIARALEDRYEPTPSNVPENNTAYTIFNGWRGIGSTSATY